MSEDDYIEERRKYINTVYKELYFVKNKTIGHVVYSPYFDFANHIVNRQKYGIDDEMFNYLIQICNFENSLYQPTLDELKKMVEAGLKIEELYKQHQIDLKLEDAEKDFE